jgi:hypothetical protein
MCTVPPSGKPRRSALVAHSPAPISFLPTTTAFSPDAIRHGSRHWWGSQRVVHRLCTRESAQVSGMLLGCVWLSGQGGSQTHYQAQLVVPTHQCTVGNRPWLAAAGDRDRWWRTKVDSARECAVNAARKHRGGVGHDCAWRPGAMVVHQEASIAPVSAVKAAKLLCPQTSCTDIPSVDFRLPACTAHLVRPHAL